VQAHLAEVYGAEAIPPDDFDAQRQGPCPGCAAQSRANLRTLPDVTETSDRPAASDRGGDNLPSHFERFVEAAYLWVSRPPFFFICLAIVLLWLVSLPLWADLKDWQVAIHTVTSVVTLLLLALLENASRRSEEASQEKLNLIAEALVALMASHGGQDRDLEEAATKLREAVGLEDRH